MKQLHIDITEDLWIELKSLYPEHGLMSIMVRRILAQHVINRKGGKDGTAPRPTRKEPS